MTRDQILEILSYDPDTGVFTWKARTAECFVNEGSCKAWNSRYAGKEAGGIDRKGYRVLHIGSDLYKAHRLAWKCHFGVEPDQIDHVNGIKDDNSIANLRDVSNAENCRNTAIPRNNSSGAIGVSKYEFKGKLLWLARIRVNDKLKHLGYFDNFDDAVTARKLAESQMGFHPNHGRARS